MKLPCFTNFLEYSPLYANHRRNQEATWIAPRHQEAVITALRGLLFSPSNTSVNISRNFEGFKAIVFPITGELIISYEFILATIIKQIAQSLVWFCVWKMNHSKVNCLSLIKYMFNWIVLSQGSLALHQAPSILYS